MNWLMKHVPNILTLSRCLATLLIVAVWYAWMPGFILPLVIFGLATDFLDGYLARKYDLSTQFGKQFDHYADKFFIITLFVIVWIELYPWQTITSAAIVLMLLILVIRDVYIAWFKMHHTQLPVLTLAKRKTTLQWWWLLAYFAGWTGGAVFLLLLATICSVVSGLWYLSYAAWWRSWVQEHKMKSLVDLILGKKKITALLPSFPSYSEFQKLATDDIKSLIIDLDGTLAPFDEPMDQMMYELLDEYTKAWIKLVIYSNTSDTLRLTQMQEKWLAVYKGSIAKPQRWWYDEIAQQFAIDLKRSIMIGDSPITDIPSPSSEFLAWVWLLKPIAPAWWVKAWSHYRLNRMLTRFLMIA